jgi:hypothetical protein
MKANESPRLSLSGNRCNIELRDLDVTGWDCVNKLERIAQSQDAMEPNRMKNRWPVNVAAFPVESLDTTAFLKKVREYDASILRDDRSKLTAAQKDQLDSYENQMVSLTGWLLVTYAGPPETANCASATFHDWHLEIFEKPSDHAPRIGDPTPTICEITPRTERPLGDANQRCTNECDFAPDAHRGDGQRFIVRADEKLTAFIELESTLLRMRH